MSMIILKPDFALSMPRCPCQPQRSGLHRYERRQGDSQDRIEVRESRILHAYRTQKRKDLIQHNGSQTPYSSATPTVSSHDRSKSGKTRANRCRQSQIVYDEKFGRDEESRRRRYVEVVDFYGDGHHRRAQFWGVISDAGVRKGKKSIVVSPRRNDPSWCT